MIPHAAWRVFLTLWLIYSLHWATDFVREHFLVASIAERGTFALDEYLGIHPDLFLHTDGHAYHGANPGISMLAAVPYAIARPLTDRIVARELSTREAQPSAQAEYDDPREARRKFYGTVRARGWDVKFGLISLITMIACMAPLSALVGTVFFQVLRGLGAGLITALTGTGLYAFGTPVFLRTGYLNQNMAVAVAGFIAFALLWNPGTWCRWSWRARWIIAGALCGFALLCDYSGGLMIPIIGSYALWGRWQEAGRSEAWRGAAMFALGLTPPILLLWFYQWAAFGFPFWPPQHYMPPIEWSDLGYQGVTGPQADLLTMLLLDPRFGLLVVMPLSLLAVAAPWVNRRGRGPLPQVEIWVMLLVSIAYILFFSMIHYTRLQYITGLRYLIPVVPFLALAALSVLARLPRVIALSVVFVSVMVNWGLAMGRFQEQEASILETLARVYLHGLQLPALTTLSKMAPQYLGAAQAISPTAAFLGTAVIVALIWTVRYPWQPVLSVRGPSHDNT